MVTPWSESYGNGASVSSTRATGFRVPGPIEPGSSWEQPAALAGPSPRPGRGAPRGGGGGGWCVFWGTGAPARGPAPPRRARRFVHDPAALETAPLAGPDGRTEWDDTVRWALARLPSESREAFLLKHVEELEDEDMARLTGAGVSALKMRVKPARLALQVMLKEAERV